MSKELTKQDLHNLAMNHVGKELKERGFEFIAVNSKLKKHPQFVCVDKSNQRFFVIVRAIVLPENPNNYDMIWMETFKNHAREQDAKVLYAGVGLGNPEDENLPHKINCQTVFESSNLHHKSQNRLCQKLDQ